MPSHFQSDPGKSVEDVCQREGLVQRACNLEEKLPLCFGEPVLDDVAIRLEDTLDAVVTPDQLMARRDDDLAAVLGMVPDLALPVVSFT